MPVRTAVAAGEAEDERDEPRGAEAAPARRSRQPQRLLPPGESWTDPVATRRLRRSTSDNASVITELSPGGKDLTLVGLVKVLFKAVIKAITQRDPDAPQLKKKRRRSGGTESRAPLCVVRQFPQHIAARGRYARLQPAVAKSMSVASKSIPNEYFSADGAWDVFDITGFCGDTLMTLGPEGVVSHEHNITVPIRRATDGALPSFFRPASLCEQLRILTLPSIHLLR
jgi:hypothetical protein